MSALNAKKELKLKINELKDILAKDGFLILGVVGSFARGEEFRDIDLVYETNEFFEKNTEDGNILFRWKKLKIILRSFWE